MQKRIAKYLCVLILTVLTSLSYAESRGHQQLVNKAVMLSGLDQQFAQMDVILGASVQQAIALNDKLNTDEKKKLTDVFVENFSSVKLIAAMKSAVSNNLTDEELSQKINIYEDPLVKKFVDAEIASSKPEVMQDMILFASNLGKNPPSQERLALIKKLDQAIKGSDTMKVMMRNTFETMMRTINDMEKKYSRAQLNDMVKQYSMMIDQSVNEQLLISYLYMYRDFKDADIEKYIKVNETNDGLRKFNDSVLYALSNYLDDYALLVAKDVSTIAIKSS